MNKYKIVSLVLAIALLGTLARLVWVSHSHPTSVSPVKADRMVVLENILSRKSVRSFMEKEVSREQLDTLVRAAMAAPTGRDMRPWKFIILDDREVMDSLAVRLPYAKMLQEAPAAILVCGDMQVTDAQGKPSGNWAFDCSAASENLLLMAEAMGLGAVWTGVYPYEDRLQTVKEALGLPEHIIPLNLIPVGYPKGETNPKDKYNSDNISYNTWSSMR
ncbi:nitroreductase family protein [gut metagenome]|uniref:Nitroreductase family protein n=1 Tax=gut metagenome TaxID=749906 RepID=J9GR26_9ZZZZ